MAPYRKNNSQTNQNNSQTNQNNSQTNQNNSQPNQNNSQPNQNNSQTNQNNSQTNQNNSQTNQNRRSNSIKTSKKSKEKSKRRFNPKQKQTKRKTRRKSSTCTRHIKVIGPTDRNLFCTFDFQGYSSTKSIDRLGRFLPFMQSIMAAGEFVHVVTGWAGHNSLGNYLRTEGFSFEEDISGLLKVHRQ